MKIRTCFVSNSSSSSFVCDAKMSLKNVEKKLELILDMYNKIGERDLPFEHMFKHPFKANKKYEEYLKQWDYAKDMEIEGKIIIESADDNSIPYELFEIIESQFKAQRVHLG